MFYCGAAGAIFALGEMITFALDMCPGRGWLLFQPLTFSHTQRNFPQTTGLHLPKKNTWKATFTHSSFIALSSVHTQSFFLGFSQEEQGWYCYLVCYSNPRKKRIHILRTIVLLPRGHLAQWLKQSLQILPFPVFNHFNLVRLLHPFFWFTSTGCFAWVEIIEISMWLLMSHNELLLVC